MKELCIGTVFKDDSPEQLKWYHLQQKYLKRTTRHYDHVVYTAGDLKTDEFSKSSIVINRKDNKRLSEAHIAGLNTLCDYFRQNKDKYRTFLLIDSDAFPIRNKWQHLISARMVKPFEIATCLRPENLERRYHASVLYAKQEALPHLRFRVEKQEENDLLGDLEMDVVIPEYQKNRKDKVFPLLRSNKYQINPLLFGIYYDMFYHNGCGSGREFNMRATSYWNHTFNYRNVDVEEVVSELMRDPNMFIGKLAGWKPEVYPEVKID